jgi:hypothetical protein
MVLGREPLITVSFRMRIGAERSRVPTMAENVGTLALSRDTPDRILAA